MGTTYRYRYWVLKNMTLACYKLSEVTEKQDREP